MDDLIKRLNGMLRARDDRPEDKWLGDGVSESVRVGEILNALEAAKARITALESERDALKHDVERHIANHSADLAAAGKEAVAIYQAGWPTPETVWGDVPKDAYDNYAQLAYTRRRIVYALPPSQPDMRWIDVNDRLPEIDYSKPAFDRAVVVLASWGGDKVAEMRYVSHGYAKREKGRAPRFEWQGRISPWLVTHWMPLPEAPANQKQAEQ